MPDAASEPAVEPPPPPRVREVTTVASSISARGREDGVRDPLPLPLPAGDPASEPALEPCPLAPLPGPPGWLACACALAAASACLSRAPNTARCAALTSAALCALTS